MPWLKGLPMPAKLIGAILAAIAALWAVLFVYDLFTAGDKVKARLGANQTDAAIESGADAVDTVGAAGDRDDATDRNTKDITDDVQNADNAVDADAAGRDGLCSYFDLCE